jgi:RNA polymerase sigma-70 factor (ECF subfamily)
VDRSEGSDWFDAVVRPSYRKIYRWALTLVGDPDQAEDVVQETVIRAYRYRASFREDADPAAWLYRITRNTALKMMKREKRKRATIRDSLEVYPARQVVTDTPDRIADRKRFGELVEALFKELSVRQREVFDLADLQGHTPTEISEMLGLDAATIRTHLFRARRVLRTRILKGFSELAEGFE